MNHDAQNLLDVLLNRLEGSSLDNHAQLLVLAAYEGDQELQHALEGAAGTTPATEEASAEQPEREAAYLESITVAGFRGIGPEATLSLQPGPGLTLVVGRNGSGMSSFAEAVEITLTGDNARWQNRTDIWRSGWRNLHAATEPETAVELAIDGDRGKTQVVRTWTGQGVAESQATAQRPGQPRSELSSLGWDQELTTYRPFLSYAELGQMIDGKPSEMYDAVASILGLERLSEAEERLSRARKSLDDADKDVKQNLKQLQNRLAETDDPRAREVETAFKDRTWDLDKVDEASYGMSTQEESGEIATLRELSRLTSPDEQLATEAAAQIRAAAENVAAQQGSDADEARHLAGLLQQALDHKHRHAGERACPVCGSQDMLDEEWAARVGPEVDRLRLLAREVDQAHEQLTVAVRSARRLLISPPDWLPEDAPVLGPWRDWAAGAQLEDPVVLAEHLERVAGPLRQACEGTREAAARQLDRLEDRWRPVAKELQKWADEARAVRKSASTREAVTKSVTWLRDVALELRNDRLRPLAEQSAWIWSELRQESNVMLGPIQLAGAKTQRRLELEVAVDGKEGSALGVMSQGELHALALSLFLPRATMTESPFRFLVIDDPVQSMDPAKVDGLAKVLNRTAEDRQVIVFTHDARLPEAIRRLQLPATIWQVTRREGSVVEVDKADDPVTRLLADARALVNTSELPSAVGLRVVPGLCRQALEATLTERIRRQRLAAGDSHADVEEAISGAPGPSELAALAFFGDQNKAGQVLSRLNNKYGRKIGDTFVACKQGGHSASPHDIDALVRDTAKLTERIRDDR